MHVYVCVCVRVSVPCVQVRKGQNRVLDHLELKFLGAGSYLTWVLEIILSSSGRTQTTFNAGPRFQTFQDQSESS